MVASLLYRFFQKRVVIFCLSLILITTLLLSTPLTKSPYFSGIANKISKLYKKSKRIISDPYSNIFLKYRIQSNIDKEISGLGKKLSGNTPDWFNDAMQEDFSNIEPHSPIDLARYKLTEEYIIENQFSSYSRIKIIGNKIYYKKYVVDYQNDYRLILFLRHLLLISKHVTLPDVDFFLSTEDTLVYALPQYSAPVFVFALNTACRKNKILIPDSLTLHNFGKLYYEIKELNKQIPWEQKIQKAYWRGSSTGWIIDKETQKATSSINSSNYKLFPRIRLVELSKLNPLILDAQFVQFVQMDEDTTSIMHQSFGLATHDNKTNQLAYKIQLTIDGNSATYPGYLWRLYANSINLKQESTEIQWFYRLIKPMIHYVPIKEDMSDLLEKIEWVESHDQEAKKIAENATNVINERLKISDIYFYIYILLQQYKDLLNFKVEIDHSQDAELL